MRSALVLSLLLFASPLFADDSESRVRVALALASVQAKSCCEPVQESSDWKWVVQGDYAYLYWQGQYYATWSYSQNRYIYQRTSAAPIRRSSSIRVGGC